MTRPATDTDLLAELRSGRLAGRWTLDPARSVLALSTRSVWGMAPVKGTFTPLQGGVDITAQGQASGQVTIDARSVDTKNAMRDKHLRSADFFDVETNPHIVFDLARLDARDGALTLVGDLTVKNVTHTVTIPVTTAGLAAGEVRITAEAVLDRSGWGLTWNRLGMASMKNTLTLTATFTRN